MQNKLRRMLLFALCVLFLGETQTTDKNRLVAELMQQLLHVPSEEDLITPTGDRTRYESFSFDDQVLYLYFDDGYRE